MRCLRGRLIIAVVVGAGVAFSGAAQAQGLFQSLFPSSSATTQASYAPPGHAIYPEDVPRSRVVPSQFHRQQVRYSTNEAPGTIVVDTKAHFLYFVLGGNRAIRYGVGVGRSGFGWSGTVHIGNKQEWPAWRPPAVMIAREARRGHTLPTYMAGGEGNPLGARAMYLYNGGGDTGYRIHGTSEPWTIGLDVSSGCVRLINDDVVDLYKRASVGAKVIVL